MNYKIVWASLLTGKEHAGTMLFSRADADEQCDALNSQWKGVFLHWAVRVTNDDA